MTIKQINKMVISGIICSIILIVTTILVSFYVNGFVAIIIGLLEVYLLIIALNSKYGKKFYEWIER